MIEISPTAISAMENILAFDGTVKFNFSVFIVSPKRFKYYFFSVTDGVPAAVILVLSPAACFGPCNFCT
jgi:hypothetical protein